MRTLLLMFVLSVACTQKEKTEPVPTSALPLDSLAVGDLVPTAGSGVYFTAGERLWYAEGSTAIEVHTPKGKTLSPTTVVPTSGKGVYVELDDDTVWYVVGDKAVPIHQVHTPKALDSVPSSPNAAVNPFLESMRKDLEARAEKEATAHDYSTDPRD